MVGGGGGVTIQLINTLHTPMTIKSPIHRVTQHNSSPYHTMKQYRCGLKSGLHIFKKNSACLIKRAAVFFYHYPGHPLTEIASYSPAVKSITHYDRGYTHFDAFCLNFNSEFQFSYPCSYNY